MNYPRRSLATLFVAAVTFAQGCGSKPISDIVGSWEAKNQNIKYAGEDVTVLTSTLTFVQTDAGASSVKGTFTESTTISYPQKGCEFAFNVTGTWAESTTNYTAQYASGSSQMSKCQDPSQDYAKRDLTVDEVAAFNARLTGASAALAGTQLSFFQFGEKLTYSKK